MRNPIVNPIREKTMSNILRLKGVLFDNKYIMIFVTSITVKKMEKANKPTEKGLITNLLSLINVRLSFFSSSRSKEVGDSFIKEKKIMDNSVNTKIVK